LELASATPHTFSLPGADAEANSNVLPGRSKPGADPLVTLAEKAVRQAASETPAETTMELLIPAPHGEVDGLEEAQGPAERTTGERAASGRATAEHATPERITRADGENAPQGPPAPDDESGTGGAGGHTSAEAEAQAEHTRTPDAPEELLTDKGLPKRTPKITAPASAPRQRSGSVDAEALRRRLGGFRRGAEAGYRDVEAEIAEQTGQNKVPSPQVPQEAHAHAEEDTGGTVEEASS
jgi:hypothetical protein